MICRPPAEGRALAFSPSNQPIVNLPPLTLGLLLAMLVVHVALWLAPASIEHLAILYFAFIPAAYVTDGWPTWSLVVAPLSYTMLHGGIGHLALNGVMLAVMGQIMERVIGRPRFLLVFVAGAMGGALVHALVGGTPQVPVIGASAAVGALYGAGFVLYRRGVPLGHNARVLVPLAGLFVILNLIGLVVPVWDNVAYAAHLGGFVTGVLVAAGFGGRARA